MFQFLQAPLAHQLILTTVCSSSSRHRWHTNSYLRSCVPVPPGIAGTPTHTYDHVFQFLQASLAHQLILTTVCSSSSRHCWHTNSYLRPCVPVPPGIAGTPTHTYDCVFQFLQASLAHQLILTILCSSSSRHRWHTNSYLRPCVPVPPGIAGTPTHTYDRVFQFLQASLAHQLILMTVCSSSSRHRWHTNSYLRSCVPVPPGIAGTPTHTYDCVFQFLQASLAHQLILTILCSSSSRHRWHTNSYLRPCVPVPPGIAGTPTHTYDCVFQFLQASLAHQLILTILCSSSSRHRWHTNSYLRPCVPVPPGIAGTPTHTYDRVFQFLQASLAHQLILMTVCSSSSRHCWHTNSYLRPCVPVPPGIAGIPTHTYDRVFQFLQASLAHQLILRIQLVEELLVHGVCNVTTSYQCSYGESTTAPL